MLLVFKCWRIAHILNLLTRIKCQSVHIMIVVRETWCLQANKWAAGTDRKGEALAIHFANSRSPDISLSVIFICNACI